MAKLASCKISIFQLISVAELAGLSFTWMHTWETGFLAWPPKYIIEPYHEITALLVLHKLVFKLSNRAR